MTRPLTPFQYRLLRRICSDESFLRTGAARLEDHEIEVAISLQEEGLLILLEEGGRCEARLTDGALEYLDLIMKPPPPAPSPQATDTQGDVMHQIVGNMLIGGVAIPMNREGRFLDWAKKKGTRAPLLCSPYGRDHFAVGGSRVRVFLNFAELPDGRFIMEADPTEGVLIHCEDLYNLHPAGNICDASFRLIERILLAVDHCRDAHDADPFYFMRALGKASGLFPAYALMTDRELRYGKVSS